MTSWTIKTNAGTGSPRIDLDDFSRLRLNLLTLTVVSLILAVTCWRHRLWLFVRRSQTTMTGSIVNSVVDHNQRQGKYSRVKANEFHPQSNAMMAMVNDDYNYNTRSLMTGRTEYMTRSLDTDTSAGGESFENSERTVA